MMKEVIDWLVQMEDTAANFYRRAAEYFSGDTELAQFLKGLCDDEKKHKAIILKAAEGLKSRNNLPSLISVDTDTKKKLLHIFDECTSKMDRNELSKNALLDAVIAAEFSEWNEIFLYAIKTLKAHSKDFIPVAAKIQQHKRFIERFLSRLPEGESYLQRVKDLPPLWQERVLVVDDSEPELHLLKATLCEEGIVETASNGREALEKIKEKYFTVIIADVEMPEMDGIDFYIAAANKYPNMKQRFLFFTADDDSERIMFFKKNKLKFMIKPAPISEIRESVVKLLDRR